MSFFGMDRLVAYFNQVPRGFEVDLSIGSVFRAIHGND